MGWFFRLSYGSVESVSLTVRIADPMVGRRQVFTGRDHRLGERRHRHRD